MRPRAQSCASARTQRSEGVSGRPLSAQIFTIGAAGGGALESKKVCRVHLARSARAPQRTQGRPGQSQSL